MRHLSSYPNVYNTCLVWLRRDGFELGYEREREMWRARKGDLLLEADNPIELLGLATLSSKPSQQPGVEYWWKVDDPDIVSELDPE